MNLQTEPARMAYWLVPAEPSLAELQSIVSELAGRFGGPVFVPHLTLYVGAFSVADRVHDILNTCRACSALTLKTTSLDFTDKYTQSCFMRFEANSALTLMGDRIRGAVSNPAAYNLEPHLSLFYGKLAPKERQTISAEISLPVEVRFNLLTSITNPAVNQSKQDVESWKETGRLSLP